ncbi:MAG: hypothetical protein ACXQTF_04335 [Candidatus Hecatellaceae archaeon]
MAFFTDSLEIDGKRLKLEVEWSRKGWIFKVDGQTLLTHPTLRPPASVFYEDWQTEVYAKLREEWKRKAEQLGLERKVFERLLMMLRNTAFPKGISSFLTFHPRVLEAYLDYVRVWVKTERDLNMALLTFITAMSAYTLKPLNTFFRGPSSTGKSYIIVQSLKFFNENDVWFLGGLSPTALAHQYGKVVEDEETGKRKYVVNMENKTLVFLEAPHIETFYRLRPILSHDRKEIRYTFTERGKKGTLTARDVYVRGWPATVWASTSETFIEELVTRSITATPELSKPKFRKAITHQGETAAYPWRYENPGDGLRLLKQTASDLAGEIQRWHVAVPYAEKIAELYPADVPQDMRDHVKLVSMVNLFTLMHVYHRPRIQNVQYEERGLLIATLQDLDRALEIFTLIAETTRLGVSEHMLKFFAEILLPMYEEWRRSLDMPREAEESPLFKGEREAEKPKGLIPTYNNILDRMIEVWGYAKSKDTVKKWVRALGEAGLVTEEPNPDDRKENYVRVLVNPKKKIETLRAKVRAGFKSGDLEAWLKRLREDRPKAKILYGWEFLGGVEELDDMDFDFRYFTEWA